MNEIKEFSSKCCEEINISKIKTMVISKGRGGRYGLTINSSTTERVSQLTYQPRSMRIGTLQGQAQNREMKSGFQSNG